jgi:hypothetical protein
MLGISLISSLGNCACISLVEKEQDLNTAEISMGKSECLSSFRVPLSVNVASGSAGVEERRRDEPLCSFTPTSCSKRGINDADPPFMHTFILGKLSLAHSGKQVSGTCSIGMPGTIGPKD